MFCGPGPGAGSTDARCNAWLVGSERTFNELAVATGPNVITGSNSEAVQHGRLLNVLHAACKNCRTAMVTKT